LIVPILDGHFKQLLAKKGRKVWHECMGASAARFQMDRHVRRMVVLAGSGHIERGFGIPARAVKRSGGKAVTGSIVVTAKPDKATDLVTDFEIIVK
jgi:uncharacterized iron-regulated protein